ncbi:uncharacterized protein LOC141690581 [Apium graveolens]|uniref:uncharacterized protein LOC141690581 n=1 Tax=Apium graveolens TaxID=4045 RepID=UPI003D7966C5
MGNPRAVRFLKELVQKHKPSLIFLSETLANKNKIEEICKGIHYAGCYVMEAQGQGGGLALLWKNTGGVEIKGSSNHYIDFEVECTQMGRWRYTGFYGCPERSRRQESWDIIQSLAIRSNLSWCMLGDYNDMLYNYEKIGGRPQPTHLLEGFSKVIMDCGLEDLGFKGSKFTWEKSRGTDIWIQERLDRGLATQGWKELFPYADITVIEVSTSDHLPLLLQLNSQVYMPRTKRFIFENVWIREAECENVVKNSWESNEVSNILAKIEYCCMKLEEWGGGKMKEFGSKIQNCRNLLRKFRSRRYAFGVKKYNEVRWEFLNLLEKQEVYWKQRAKQFWLQEGDQNTRYFHKFASGRKRNNQICKLKNKDGEWKDNKQDIQGIITDYFTELFTSSRTAGSISSRDKVQGVTVEQNEQLIKPISNDEVKSAAFLNAS